jgi:hypothetical protein
MSGIGVDICYPLFHGDILEGCLDERASSADSYQAQPG